MHFILMKELYPLAELALQLVSRSSLRNDFSQ
jgi:hypothetical protein